MSLLKKWKKYIYNIQIKFGTMLISTAFSLSTEICSSTASRMVKLIKNYNLMSQFQKSWKIQFLLFKKNYFVRQVIEIRLLHVTNISDIVSVRKLCDITNYGTLLAVFANQGGGTCSQQLWFKYFYY